MSKNSRKQKINWKILSGISMLLGVTLMYSNLTFGVQFSPGEESSNWKVWLGAGMLILGLIAGLIGLATMKKES